MKKLVTTTGGHPFRLDDIMLMQSANIEGTKAMLDGLCRGYSATGVYLSGADFTTVGPTTTVSAGFAYWNGEIYPIDTQNLPPTIPAGNQLYWQITQEILPPSPVTYQDNNTHNVHIREKLVLVIATSAPVGGFLMNNVLRLEQITGSPKGSILPYYGPTSNFSPSGDGLRGTPVFGYALCDGGSSTLITGGVFARPNFNGKVLVGYDSTDADFNGVTGGSIPNSTGGEKAHILTPSELPPHKHRYRRPTKDNTSLNTGTNASDWKIADGGGEFGNTEDGATVTSGGATPDSPGPTTTNQLQGTAHNNLQPFATVLWIIKLY